MSISAPTGMIRQEANLWKRARLETIDVSVRGSRNAEFIPLAFAQIQQREYSGLDLIVDPFAYLAEQFILGLNTGMADQSLQYGHAEQDNIVTLTAEAGL